MKIFVDFDDVLFHTKAFADDLMALFERHGVTHEQFDESYHAFPHRDPRKQIIYLQKKYAVNAAAVSKDFDHFIVDIKKYLFPDVIDFLTSFAQKDLYLLTFGAKVFQNIKIHNAGIEQYFYKMIVTQGKKMDRIVQIADEEKFAGSEKIILIDDHPAQLEKSHRGERGIVCIHLRRSEGRYSKYACMGCDGEALNFTQVKELIDKVAQEEKVDGV